MWNQSSERQEVEANIEQIHAAGKLSFPVASDTRSEFATSWMTQFKVLYTRENISRWRNPTYLLAKMVLNIASGLFIGVSACSPTRCIEGLLTPGQGYILSDARHAARHREQNIRTSFLFAGDLLQSLTWSI